jgi:hypothetical protein
MTARLSEQYVSSDSKVCAVKFLMLTADECAIGQDVCNRHVGWLFVENVEYCSWKRERDAYLHRYIRKSFESD